MRIGDILGAEAQKTIAEKKRNIDRARAKQKRQQREAEDNRKRQRGQTIRYHEDE